MDLGTYLQDPPRTGSSGSWITSHLFQRHLEGSWEHFLILKRLTKLTGMILQVMEPMEKPFQKSKGRSNLTPIVFTTQVLACLGDRTLKRL